ncbi:MAG TPA: 4'-phosphopantetheinyl transferase superfamily protein [Chitinophagaceae bacterium]|nr:4'-phosphopantetheinyl transferase superfamily protein [Chitinophagaceae bacterium]
MPLIRIIQAQGGAKVGIWHITEPETFFRENLPEAGAGMDLESAVHHPHKRLQHLAARYLLVELEPALPIEMIRIAASRKPYIPGNHYHFSLAHCGDYATAIVSAGYPVGIDVEKITPKITRVAHKFLHPAELAFIDPACSMEHLTLCWSAKEAVYKWYGEGGVDFKEHIRLQPFVLYPRKGEIRCHFGKGQVSADLQLHYLLGKDHDVTWLVDTAWCRRESGPPLP